MSNYTERLKREAAERAEKERAAIKQAMGGIPAHVRAVDPNQIIQEHTQAMSNDTGGVAVSIIALGENRAVGIARPDGQASSPPDVVKLLLDTALRILVSATEKPQAAAPKLVGMPEAPGTH